MDDEGNCSNILRISQDVKDKLDSLYNDHFVGLNAFSFSYIVYQAKTNLQIMPDIYDVSEDSDEFYGLWLYFSLLENQYKEAISLFLQCVNTALAWANVANQAVVLYNGIQLLSSQTTTLTAQQYLSAKAAYNEFSTISPTQAITEGKTDLASFTGTRPSWQASEQYVCKIYNITNGYKYNQAYKLINGTLQEVPRNAVGSVRPDMYNPFTNHLVEVKNYTITTSSGRNNLINVIIRQYEERLQVFPSGLQYEVRIDVRGQNYTPSMLDEIRTKIGEKSNNKIETKFIFN